MRIIIATGIFPPEIGGPAYYSKNLAEALQAQGHDVRIVLYGRLKSLPSGVRHALYAVKLLWHSLRADGIIAFDTYSVGLPAAFVSMPTGIPVVARIGGDFMWETYTERTQDLMPLPEMYNHRDRWNNKERLIFTIQSWVIRRVHLAFSCTWIRDIWRGVYEIDDTRAHVIENPIPPKLESRRHTRKNFAFYTRQIALKNNEAFRKAFISAKNVHPEIELEEGMVPKDDLMRRMQSCYAVVLPSISDVTPNYIIDAIRCGKPFLLTKYSGYAERFRQYGVIVDPVSIDDMTRGVLELAEDKSYDQYKKRIAEFNEIRTYDDIAREFVAVLASIRGSPPR